MRCDEAQELITARLDDELDAEERVSLEAHLGQCTDCALTFAQESVLKRRIRLVAQQIGAPVALRQRIERNTAAAKPVKKAWPEWSLRNRFALPGWRRNEETRTTPSAIKRVSSTWNFRAWLALPTWRRALIAAMFVSVVTLIFYAQRQEEKNVGGIASESFAVHESILSGKTALLHAVNLAAMRREMASAVGDRFKPVVLDFSMKNLHPVAGFVRNIAGRDMLVTVYQGDGPTITCFTFLGSESDAPQGVERLYDAPMNVNYYSFSKDGLSAVLHREGDVMCLLVSKMAAANLIALLRGKSTHG